MKSVFSLFCPIYVDGNSSFCGSIESITGNAVPATAISSFVLLCSIFDRPGLAPSNSKYINAAISRRGGISRVVANACLGG